MRSKIKIIKASKGRLAKEQFSLLLHPCNSFEKGITLSVDSLLLVGSGPFKKTVPTGKNEQIVIVSETLIVQNDFLVTECESFPIV